MSEFLNLLSSPVALPQTVPFGCLLGIFLLFMFGWFASIFSSRPLYTPEERLDKIEKQLAKTHGAAWSYFIDRDKAG